MVWILVVFFDFAAVVVFALVVADVVTNSKVLIVVA